MSIVTMFFDQQKAGEINAIINNNFKNVSKYIPIGFDSLTTVERLNLGEDWKEHGKLVFDIDQEKVYIWDEDTVDWIAYLIEAKDSYARALAEETQQKSFAKVVLGTDCILRFKNALGEEVGNQLLSADKLQYDSTDSVLSKINKLVAEDKRQQGEIDTINKKIGNIALPTDAQTITGAIKELHTELSNDTADLTGIKNGTIVVPKAVHAEEADHATDSSNLDGKAPSYYAKQSDMTTAQSNIAQNTTNISNNTVLINEVKDDLTELSNQYTAHLSDYNKVKNTVSNDSNRIDALQNQMAGLGGVLKIVDEDFIVEIATSKATYNLPSMPNFNPNTDAIRIFINGGYTSKSNYTVAFTENADGTYSGTITNKNHTTTPWQVGWEINVLTTRLVSLIDPVEPDTPAPVSTTGIMTATVGDTLDETGGDTPEPVIKVQYTIEFYYDNELDSSKTIIEEVDSGTEITIETIQTSIDNNKGDYDYDKVENVPLTTTESSESNLIKVYYISKPVLTEETGVMTATVGEKLVEETTK